MRRLILALTIFIATVSPSWSQSREQVDTHQGAGGQASLVQSTGVVQVQDRSLKGPVVNRDTSPYAVSSAGTTAQLITSVLPWGVGSPGQALPRGAAVDTGEKSSARLSLAEGVQIELDHDASVILPAPDQPDRLILQRGRAWVHARRGLTVQTARGEVHLTGAELVVVAGPTESTVSLIEGRVRLGNRELKPGQEATFTHGGTKRARIVDVDVNTRRAWVQETVTPDTFALQPYFVDDASRRKALLAALSTLESNPQSAAAQVDLARIYLDEGRLDKARSALDQAADVPQATALRGRLSLLEGRYAEARKDLESYLSAAAPEPTEQVRSNVDLGVSLWALRDLNAARVRFDAALKLNPHEPYTLANTGYLMDFQDGEYALAARRLADASRRIPNQPIFHRQLGDAYATLGSLGSAVAEYRRTLTLNPDGDPTTYLRMGSALTRLGQVGGARQAFSDYRKHSVSRLMKAYAALSVGYLELLADHLKEAASNAAQALSISKSLDPSARFLALDLQGLILARKRDYGKATETYREALRLSPGDPFVTNDLGLALLDTGEQTSALQLLAEAREKAPSSAAVRGNLGMLYALLGLPRHAQEELERAVAMSPTQGNLWDTLGDVFEQLDRTDAAGHMRLQGRLLNPLLIAPRPLRMALGADLSESNAPSYSGEVSASANRVAARARIELDRGLGSPNAPTPATQQLTDLRQYNKIAGTTAELGWLPATRDHIWAGVYAGPFETRGLGQQTLFTPQDVNVAYYHELGPATGFWLRWRDFTLGQQFDSTGRLTALGTVTDSRSSLTEQSVEARLDQSLGRANLLSIGFADLHDGIRQDVINLSPNPNTSSELHQRITRPWVSDQWRLGRLLSLTLGATFDTVNERSTVQSFSRAGLLFNTSPLTGSASTANPFLALTWRPGPGTQVSFTTLRESDITQQARDALLVSGTQATNEVAVNSRSRLFSYNYLLPSLISSTTMFPLNDTDRTALALNSSAGLGLPYWDYRLQWGQEMGTNSFLSAEVFDTEVFRSDVGISGAAPGSPVPQLQPDRSHLHGGSLRFETSNGRDLVGSIQYYYRNYRFLEGPSAGNRWLLAPQHDLEARVVKQIGANFALELNPGLQSRQFLNRANSLSIPPNLTTSVLVHWTPAPGARLSGGYQNLFSANPTLPKGWVLVFRMVR